MSKFGYPDRFTSSLSEPQFTPLYSGPQVAKLDNKQYIPVYIVACITEDGYIGTDSCYNDYGKASDRADELMNEDDREWEVLTCRLEY